MTRPTADLLSDMLATVQRLSSDLTTAQQFRDDNLIQQAQEATRIRLADEAKKTALTAAQAIFSEADKAAVNAEESATPHRPTYDPNDAGQVSRSGDAWRFNILPQLDAGKHWNTIIPTISYDDAIAIERFAPTYVRAHAKTPQDAAAELALIQAGIFQRSAALATSDEGRAAITAASATADTARTLQSVLQSVSNTRKTSDLIPAGITLKSTLANTPPNA